jgi:BirA family biotin operon repressor/biotin-[acetyl-CoA-carboxylase] ligase
MKLTDVRSGIPGFTTEPPVIHLDTVDSTNAEALRRARAGARALWVVAGTQTAGRGRRGRAGVSPAGNLYASLLLVDPAPAAVAPQLAFVAGLAVHDACAALAPGLADALMLKWPNDLLCRGAKIAGILIEGEGGTTGIAAVIGIGVNCRHHPDAVEHPATDFAARGTPIEAPALFETLRRTMAARLMEWDRGEGFAAIRGAWLARAAGLGQPMRARLPDCEVSGVFEALDPAGRLVLRLADGRREVITAGEVFPVREEPA